MYPHFHNEYAQAEVSAVVTPSFVALISFNEMFQNSFFPVSKLQAIVKLYSFYMKDV